MRIKMTKTDKKEILYSNPSLKKHLKLCLPYNWKLVLLTINWRLSIVSLAKEIPPGNIDIDFSLSLYAITELMDMSAKLFPSR